MTSTRHFNGEICFLRQFHWILLPRFGTKLRKSTIRQTQIVREKTVGQKL